MVRKKIAIFGAGVGGLTVAHQLSCQNFDVTIYEKKNAVGGLARSQRDTNGCATEYCWRVFFGFYHNLLNILKEIPTSTGSCIDNLTTYHHVNISKPTSLKDKLIALVNIFQGMMSSDERLAYNDNLTWYEALGSSSDSNLFREIGGWLGMDRYKGSYRSVIKVGMEMQIFPSYCSEWGMCDKYEDYVTTMPTSEAIFDNWVNLLKTRGVKFEMNTSLYSIEEIDGNISNATLDTGETVNADQYVLCVPVEALQLVFSRSILSKDIGLENIINLAETCLHIQLSFQVYFNRALSLGGDKNAFLLVESPWDIIVLSYDKIYKTNICFDVDSVKGAWSVAVCTAYIPGEVHRKTFSESSYTEILDELNFQLFKNKILKARVEKENDCSWTQDLVVGWSEMWPTYTKYPEKQLTTTEPKFTNNAGSYKLRPSYKTPYSNLYIATGYIKETIDIFSMEAACIAGKRVSHSICSESSAPTIVNRPVVFAPFRAFDKILFNLHLPNAFIVIVIILVVYVACSIISKRG